MSTFITATSMSWTKPWQLVVYGQSSLCLSNLHMALIFVKCFTAVWHQPRSVGVRARLAFIAANGIHMSSRLAVGYRYSHWCLMMQVWRLFSHIEILMSQGSFLPAAGFYSRAVHTRDKHDYSSIRSSSSGLLQGRHAQQTASD
jgi:hypothetical protein